MGCPMRRLLRYPEKAMLLEYATEWVNIEA